jgi:hypothetical protein
MPFYEFMLERTRRRNERTALHQGEAVRQFLHRDASVNRDQLILVPFAPEYRQFAGSASCCGAEG